ncbi:hypothetical protein RKD05_002969 [Microbacterium sp. SLBN-111]
MTRSVARSDLVSISGAGYDLGGATRSLLVRVPEAARAQFEALADLNALSLTGETRLSLKAWIEQLKSDAEVL